MRNDVLYFYSLVNNQLHFSKEGSESNPLFVH